MTEEVINLTDEEKDLIRKERNEYYRARREENREEYNAYHREYYHRNKEQIRLNQANYWLRKAKEKNNL